MTRPISIATLFALAACGGTALPGLNGVASCTIAISGAVTANVTQDCVPSAVVTDGKLGFGISPEGTDTYGSLNFVAEFPGTSFATGTYNATLATSSATSLVNPPNTDTVWEQTSTQADAGNLGTFSLVITSTGTQVNGTGGTTWVGSHGTLDATLPPAPGNSSTSNVTLHIGF